MKSLLRNYFLIIFACVVSGHGILAQDGVQDARDFYRDKTVAIVVGYSTGGGYDTFARLVAPRLADMLDANVVVQNRPGASGLMVVNQAQNAQPDGLTITLVNVSAAMSASLVPNEATRFDLKTLTWLGGIQSDPRSLILPADKTIGGWQLDEQSPAVIRWPSVGLSDNLAISAALISESLGLNSKIIPGYDGTSEAIAALLRGEADAAVVSLESAQRAAAPDTIRIAAVVATERSALAPDVPTIFELTGKPEHDKWLNFSIGLTTLGRAYLVPPGTPPERVELLTDLIREIVKDPEFVAAAGRLGRTLDYASPQSLSEIVAQTLDNPDPDFREQLVTILGDKYF